EQGDLLAPPWADPAALEAAFDRIRGREGEGAVAIPESRDGHLPEDAGAWGTQRAGGSGDRGTEKTSRLRRLFDPPVSRSPAVALRHLHTPEPVRVRLGRSGIEAFRHGETWHDVTAWSGPG